MVIGAGVVPSIVGVGGNNYRLFNDKTNFTLDDAALNDEEPNYFDLHEIANFFSCAWGLTSADFNDDGYVDFAVSYAMSQSYYPISIFYNNGNLEFTKDDVYIFSYCPISDLDSGDYDSDGDIDLMFTYSEHVWYGGLPIKVNGTVNLLFNDGENNFGDCTMVAWHGPGTPYDPENRINPQLSSADYNMDGDIDFLVGDNSGKIEFYLNNGTGNFTSAGIINDWGRASWGVTSADYDNDGDIDFLVASDNDEGDDAYIYLKRNQMIESNFTTCFDPGPGEIIVRTGITASLTSFDYDNDGDMDFVAGIIHYVFLCINKQEVFYPFYIYKLPNSPEGYGDNLCEGALTTADYNNDGYDDLITGGVQGVVRLFINNYGKTPTVSIEKPEEKQLYIFDKSMISLLKRTLIFGKITVEAKVTVAPQKIEFYVDDDLEYNDTEYPYEWLWDKLSFGRHSIKVIAYDTNGNYFAEDEITVWKFF